MPGVIVEIEGIVETEGDIKKSIKMELKDVYFDVKNFKIINMSATNQKHDRQGLDLTKFNKGK